MPARRAYTDAEVEAAIAVLADPERLEEAQRMVGANAPGNDDGVVGSGV